MAKLLVIDEWKILRGKLLDEHKKLIYENVWCPPVVAQQLLILGEDHRFFRHYGIDFYAICRAIWKRFAFGIIEGASTIDQQIVRVLTGRFERTIRRKIREVLLATLLTSVIPKKDLPCLYLTIGYFGWRMNNFRQACTRLNLKSGSITVWQAAELVARIKYPEPRVVVDHRLILIHRRSKHLIWLYENHLLKKSNEKLRWKVSHASI